MNRIPIVIDVDTGTDDAVAIVCALLNRDILDIKAFTTVMGNVSINKTSRNTLDLVSALECGIKVAVGRDSPLKRKPIFAVSHGSSGLGDLTLPVSTATFYRKDGVDTLYEEAGKENGRLQILATGPLTNIAAAIQKYPDITGLIDKITIMGGGLWGGNMTMTSEFNMYVDPEAASVVFSSGVPLWMVGLDVTLKPQLPDWVADKVKESRTLHAQIVTEIFRFMRRRSSEFGGDLPNLHDVIALCAVLHPEIFVFRKYYMEIECTGDETRGMTLADFNNVKGKSPNVHAAVDINIDAFWQWFIRNFA